MQHTTTSPKRSNYPLTAVFILLVHLGLGYMIYQEVIRPNNGTEQKAIQTQETPAIP